MATLLCGNTFEPENILHFNIIKNLEIEKLKKQNLKNLSFKQKNLEFLTIFTGKTTNLRLYFKNLSFIT